MDYPSLRPAVSDDPTRNDAMRGFVFAAPLAAVIWLAILALATIILNK